MDCLQIRAAEPLEARGFAPTQTSNPSGESAFPRPLRKAISVGTRERFVFAVPHGVFGSVSSLCLLTPNAL